MNRLFTGILVSAVLAVPAMAALALGEVMAVEAGAGGDSAELGGVTTILTSESGIWTHNNCSLPPKSRNWTHLLH